MTVLSDEQLIDAYCVDNTQPVDLAGLRAVADAAIAADRAQGAQGAQGAEPVRFAQFLSHVMTAAGLVRHGKQSAALAERIGEDAMHFMLTRPQPAAVPESQEESRFMDDFERGGVHGWNECRAAMLAAPCSQTAQYGGTTAGHVSEFGHSERVEVPGCAPHVIAAPAASQEKTT